MQSAGERILQAHRMRSSFLDDSNVELARDEIHDGNQVTQVSKTPCLALSCLDDSVDGLGKTVGHLCHKPMQNTLFMLWMVLATSIICGMRLRVAH